MKLVDINIKEKGRKLHFSDTKAGEQFKSKEIFMIGLMIGVGVIR